MKAEDTVLELEMVAPKFPDYIPCAVWDVLHRQAEVSFAAGIKLVVEWQCSHKVIGFCFDTDSEEEEQELRLAWSMQLKEWGI